MQRRTNQNRENERDGSAETCFIEGELIGTISRLRESLFGAEREEKPTGVMNFIKNRYLTVDFKQIGEINYEDKENQTGENCCTWFKRWQNKDYRSKQKRLWLQTF